MGGLTLLVRASVITFDGKPGYDGADSADEHGNAWAPDPLPGTWPDLHTWYRWALLQSLCLSTSFMLSYGLHATYPNHAGTSPRTRTCIRAGRRLPAPVCPQHRHI